MKSDEPKPVTLPPSKVAEVQTFLRALEAVRDLFALFPKPFAKLAELVPAHNTSLVVALNRVRELGVSCGPIELYSYTKRFDAQAYYDALGRTKFAQLGGIIEPVEKLTIDAAIFASLVEQKKIDPALAAVVLKRTPNFHAPKAIVLP